MLNPEANPLYRQILYDGEKKTYIRTLQNHKNNFDHAEIYKWNNKTDFNRNLDKITSPRNLSLNPSYIRCKGPEDHQIFTPLKQVTQPTIPLKYQQRYASQSQLFPTTSPRIAESSAALIGKFILNDGLYKLPPLQEPSETYRNRSHVFFG